MFVEVLVELKQKSVDRLFTYEVPSALEKKVAVGKRVLVSFGAQTLSGFILNIKNESKIEAKKIIDILDQDSILNDELINIGKFLKQKTLCSLSSALATILPVGLKAKKTEKVKDKYETILTLNVDTLSAYHLASGEKQKEIIKRLSADHILTKKEASLISISSLHTLVKKEIIREEKRKIYRLNNKPKKLEKKRKLTRDQEIVFQQILTSFQQNKTFLLHGVTGSGKTEIYMQLIEEVLKNKQQAILLVPEISLASQLIHNFINRFGNEVAIIHSNLADAERYDEWKKIKNGEANIIVGVRSAVFVPVNNLGIIILDEEHANSYKQDNTPKYHTLDVAKYRTKQHNCPLVLGSATPSLESMSRAKKNIYTYLSLPNRVDNRMMPTVEFVDMEKEIKKRNFVISEQLKKEIEKTLSQKQQVMLMLNRRGFSTFITCSSCGYTYKCPNCDISLTYHKENKTLQCHYCGYTKIGQKKCPNCQEEALNYYGLGTEKLAQIINDLFPTARLVRMDADTTRKKNGHEKIVNAFLRQEYDILIGTQMISKGLDFPSLTLVGIINADTSLNIPNFRSGEETFSLLLQTSGRAGRDKLSGKVIIQTFNPDNFVLQCVRKQDYFQFYHYEMNIRKKLKYPPFYFLANVKIKSSDYQSALEESTKIKEILLKDIGQQSIILGPSASGMMKINNIFNLEITIKYRELNKIIDTLKEIDGQYIMNRHVKVELDLSC